MSRAAAWRLTILAVAFAAAALSAPRSAAAPDRPHAGNASPDVEGRTPPDDLYRRRGYGTGGLTFGLGRSGGTAQAGACADLAFARPRSCGPEGGYGIYGNGLGYGF